MCVCVFVSHQVDQHTHVLLREPMEEVCRVAGQDLVVMESRDGLDALLKLL